MLINTRDFGEVEVGDNDVVTFASPVFGFDEYSKYVFLFDDEMGEHFVWLQSVENADICFILMDPGKVKQDYNIVLEDNVISLLGEGEYVAWAIVVIKDDFAQSTVNLKAPIIINPSQGVALQAIVDDNYPVQHPIFENQEG